MTHTTVLPLLSLIGLGLLLVHGWVLVARRRGAVAPAWAPFLLRVLAVLGLVLPGWVILGWYRDLTRARELTRAIPMDTGPIVDRFLVESATLLSLGFLLLVTGIYLARRAGRARSDLGRG